MLILLPPSEGKTRPRTGSPLDPSALSYPELTRAREEIIDALIAASAGGPGVIGAPPTTTEEVAANQQVRSAPTAPAREVYTGVLFAAAGLTDLPPEAAERARSAVRIASTVFGFLAPGDRIPGYRLPPAAKLPAIGSPISHLAPAVARAMGAHGAPVVLDCRSGPYLRLWRPTAPWVQVKAVEVRGGVPVSVSHFAKHHRGVLTRHFLTRAPSVPTNVEEILLAAQELTGIEYSDVTMTEGKSGRYQLELTIL